MDIIKDNSLRLYSAISTPPLLLWLFVIVFTLTSCAPLLRRDYTTEVKPISCGNGQSFVYPIEFDEDGDAVHESQLSNIIQSLNKDQIQDVYIFVHGWNNTVPIAKDNYEKFICRFRPFSNLSTNNHNEATTSQNSIAISLFWPSTVNPDSVDQLIMMPKTYYDILERADHLAITGFHTILLALQDMEYKRQGRLRLHLVGHSFGGRIVANGIFSFLTDMKNHPTLLFDKLDRLDIVLLLAAIPNTALDTHNLREEVMAQAKRLSTEDIIGEVKAKEYDRQFEEAIRLMEEPPHDVLGATGGDILGALLLFGRASEKEAIIKKELEEAKLRASKSLRELGVEYDRLKVFTIYSKNDDALGFAFPLASIFNRDLVGCALGGCGAAADEKLLADAQGNLGKDEKLPDARMLSIDATALVSGHTDIYKDQVAELIWRLLFIEKSGHD